MMYPLLLTPPLKSAIWGGTRLQDEWGFETQEANIAEVWSLSCHKDGECVVKNGSFAGQKLSKVLENWGEKGIGTKAAAFPYFPLLIKLIDAKDRLSIQVHPDNEYALKNEGEYGKTEMWYVVDCDEGAQLIYGFNRDISRSEFVERIKNNTLSSVCNYVPVKKGDIFFISAGTLHAIGKGILIAEIQQNSNTTYRVSDYGRIGADGKPRPLHVEKALAVTDTHPPKKQYGPVGNIKRYSFGTIRELAKCEFFTTQLLSLDGQVALTTDAESFQCLLVLSGEAVISYAGGNMRISKGNCVLIPANFKCTLSGGAEIISSRV